MSDKRNIYESICGVMTDIGAVGKDSRNEQQKFMFRGIDAVMNALSPVLLKNKVFIVPTILEQTREERTNKNGTTLIYSICKVQYTFYAEDGSFIESVVIGEGMDTGDKATNKAMSIAFKYACFQVFCIPTEEMVDPDAECHEVKKKEEPKVCDTAIDTKQTISATQIKALVSRCQKEGVKEELIKSLYKAADFKDLTIVQYTNINDHWDRILEMSK